ncbi:MAG: S-layer homology domain-containing protein [Clostridiales bacterium]|nr:S-layer homology domain-containing protein [Clostridiales bacterium]
MNNKDQYNKKIAFLLAAAFTLYLCMSMAAPLCQPLGQAFCQPLAAADGADAGKAALAQAVSDAASYIHNTVKAPEIGSVGGEWAVIGLARSGFAVPDAYYQDYYRRVEKYVRDHNGVLHDRKYTEYSRVILGLTAAGFDPRDVAGYDLTAPLGDFDKTVWQGVNGPVWALIALDSLDYAIPVNHEASTQATRDLYIADILRRQTQDGGWNLTAGAEGAVSAREKGDVDLTGMALQALAKYQAQPEVKAAVDRAVAFLSKTQDAKGGYTSSFSAGSSAVESAVQVTVALCRLGIPLDDTRFVKSGNSLVNNILLYRTGNGGSKHTLDGSGSDLMASEQALYGLAAAIRAMEGKNSIYQMADTVKRVAFKHTPGSGLPGKHADIKGAEVKEQGKTFADVAGHRSKAAIDALAARGVIGGRDAERFDPDATMTRAEFAAIVTRALGLPTKQGSAFADVSASAWYAQAVGTAYYYELVSGTSATTFSPEGTITRQEAAVMTARAAKLAGMDTGMNEIAVRNALAQFDDYRTVADWAAPLMAFCYAQGILDDAALTIQPTAAIKRCEVADMLYRMLGAADLLA